MSAARAWRFLRLAALFAVVGSGCTTLTVSPDLPGTPGALPLRGHLDFDGNPNYLPEPLRTLEQSESGPTFRYVYDVEYDETDLSVLALFNPLTLFGFPTGSARLTAAGKVEVVGNGSVLKRYVGRCEASHRRTIYGGDALSALRARALEAVARSVAVQMSEDRSALTALINTTGASGP